MQRLPQIATIVLCCGVFAFAVFGRSQPQDSNQIIAAAQQSRMAKTHGDQMPMAGSSDELQLDDPAPFAFIELFTSEGCSSCPRADQNLEKIAAAAEASGQNTYTLSYHVDYWNYLGWNDPYSIKAFSTRQRQYAKQFESNRVYTPQMVVNGQAEFVGSNRKMSERGVSAALKLKPETAIAVTATVDKETVNVDWKAKGIEPGSVVQVALVQNEGVQNVSRGENAGRKLTHVNIVRHLETVRRPGNAGQVELATPKGFAKEDFHVVAFVQSAKSVDAAARSAIGMKMSMKKPPMKMKHGAMKDGAMQDGKMQDGKKQDGKKEDGEKKNAVDSGSASKAQESKKKLVSTDKFIELLSQRDPRVFIANLAELEKNWDIAYVPMLLEVGRFVPNQKRVLVINLLQSKTGNKFGYDFDKWRQWNWKQKYEPHPDYAKFKSTVYQDIDPRFAEYFTDTEDAKIRLDEIRWGGVRRDGIPPLDQPKMTSAAEATYLADTDVVFGIELNGDARAYPKRILAWHEMFKDTIGGESVCGVY